MDLLLILIGVLSRLVPHPANMTAIGGIALFSGAKYDTKKALIVTVMTMMISDAIIGFHSLMWATYGSLIIAVVIGKQIGARSSVQRKLGGVLASSAIFYIITNFAVWAATPLYPKTLDGLVTSYIMAIPFFRNSLMGDVISSFALFVLFDPMMSLAQKVKRICISLAVL